MSTTAIENILARATSSAGDASSRTVTALVVQGGGMRGVYSMAALMALEECGLGAAFDHVFGSSAGAINAAYFLAGQSTLAVRVYLDDLSSTRFVDWRRLWKIVDIDFLVDNALTLRKPLSVGRLRSVASTLHVVLTDYASVRPYVVTNHDDCDFMEVLRATAAMPLVYGRTVPIRGRDCIDGGVTESLPLLRAIEHGCTDILVVVTRPLDWRDPGPGAALKFVGRLLLWRHREQMRRRMIAFDCDGFNRAMNILANGSPTREGVRLAVIAPSDVTRLASVFATERSKLMATALMARNDARAVLGYKPACDNPF